MLIRRAELIHQNEITDPGRYLRRRDFLRHAGLAAGAAFLTPAVACRAESTDRQGLSISLLQGLANT